MSAANIGPMDIFWIFIMATSLQPLMKQRWIEAASRQISRFGCGQPGDRALRGQMDARFPHYFRLRQRAGSARQLRDAPRGFGSDGALSPASATFPNGGVPPGKACCGTKG